MPTNNSGYNPATDSCCGIITQAIVETNDPANLMPATGVVAALKSPANTAGFSLTLPPTTDGYADTSFKKVYTKSVKPKCHDLDEADEVCVTPNTSGAFDKDMFITSNHTIEESIKVEIPFDVTEFDKLCGENGASYLANRMLAHKANVWKRINAKATTTVKAYMGAYHDQISPDTSITAPKSVSLFTPNTFTGNSVLSRDGFAVITGHYGYLDYNYINPVIVGGAHVQHLIGLNGNNAVPNLYFDAALDPSFGDSLKHLLTWSPGTLQLIDVQAITPQLEQYNVAGVRERYTMFSPFGDGFTWDVYVDWDTSGCKMMMKFQLHFDVICPIPYDMVCTKKPALHFLSDCEPMDCAAISSIQL